MKNRIRTVLPVLTVLILVSLAPAGSFFTSSARGIGVRLYSVSARGMGMGGTGLALSDVRSLATYNVSQWYQLRDTRIQSQFSYQVDRSDVGKDVFSRSTGNFGGFSFAVPIERHRWVMGLSLTPYTQVDFDYKEDGTTEGKDFTESVFSKGTISKAQLSLVYSPHSKFALAISANFYFGTIRDRFVFNFADNSFFNSSHSIEYRFQGPGGGFSFNYRPSSRLNFGGFADFQSNLNVSRVFSSPVSNEKFNVTGGGHFPVHYGVGTSFQIHSGLLLAADYSAQNWGDGFGIAAIPREILEDWWHVGAGLEHKIVHKQGEKFVDYMDLRGGFSVTQLGYKFNGNGVKEFALHGGLGIPFFSHVGRLDIGLKAGIRGRKSKNLASEKFFKILFSVSMGELWFQRPR